MSVVTYFNVTGIDPMVPLSASDWTGGEYFSVIFGVIVNVISLVGLIYMNVRHDIKYIKFTQVAVLNISYFAMIMYWFTFLIDIRLISKTAPAFLICDLWLSWLSWPFGIALLISCFVFRLWRLYRVLVQGKPASGWFFYAVPIIIWSPSVIISIASTATHSTGPAWVGGVVLCYYQTAISYTFEAHLVVMAIILLVLSIRLYRVRNAIISEYWATIIIIIDFVVVIITISGVNAGNGQFQPWGRIVETLLVLWATNFSLWMLIGRPIFNSLFRHEAALAEFDDAIKARLKVIQEDSIMGTSSRAGIYAIYAAMTAKLGMKPTQSSEHLKRNLSAEAETQIPKEPTLTGRRSRSFHQHDELNLSMHEEEQKEIEIDRLPPAAKAMLPMEDF